MTLHFRITRSVTGEFLTEFANQKFVLKPQGIKDQNLEALIQDVTALITNYFKNEENR